MANSIETKQRVIKSLFSMLFVAGVIGLALVTILTGDKQTVGIGLAGRPIDELWVLTCAALVFIMQAGFLCYEVGLARPIHATVVAIKNVVDWTISTVGFFTVGFAFMFGDSWSGIIGTDSFLLLGVSQQSVTVGGLTFFIFQLAFAGTAITLVSGSLVERTSMLAYSVIAIALAVFIYPIYGHWVWGDLLNTGNRPWLAELGFHDFAGGTVVHLLGAVVALMGILLVGPRIGRFNTDGTPNEMKGSNIPLALLGIIILWFGWWGFNGGSFLEFDGNVGRAVLVTNISAVAGLVGAGFTGYLYQKSYALNMKLVGGAIGGLVAITPGADVVTPVGAIVTGLLAGVIYSLGNDLLLRWGIDDALGVIPAHGFGAILGTLSLSVFAADGSFDRPVLQQLGIQALGVTVCIVWGVVTSFVFYGLIQMVIGLRMSPREEIVGFELESQVWPYGSRQTVQPSQPSTVPPSLVPQGASAQANGTHRGQP